MICHYQKKDHKILHLHEIKIIKLLLIINTAIIYVFLNF